MPPSVPAPLHLTSPISLLCLAFKSTQQNSPLFFSFFLSLSLFHEQAKSWGLFSLFQIKLQHLHQEEMGSISLPDMAVGIIHHCPTAYSGSHWKYDKNLCLGRRPPIFRTASKKKKSDDSSDTFADVVETSGRNEVLNIEEDELMTARKALSEAQARQEAIEKERDQLLEKLACSEAKQQEYVATILHEKELAIAEVEAAKSLFDQKLQESVEEKFSLESKLVLAKNDAVELAVQVEKLAEIAFQQATSHILEDAQLRVSAAETAAAEAAYEMEKQIRDVTEGSILSIVEQSKYAIEKALDVAEKAGEHATKAVSEFTEGMNPLDELASIQSKNIMLQGVVNDLESQLLLTRSDVDRLKLELEKAHAHANAFELRAKDAEKALLEFQESSKKNTLQKEEEIMSLIEKMKKDSSERKKNSSKAF
ncbi:hypothetical protein GBA52_028888 [Prunus armeniaca]|nr:hypothetical protein GBA52_028888 [Prunus armeniaca]